MNTTGARIKAARLAAKLTQAEAVALVGVHQSNWSEWEHDQHPPTVASLKRIGKALKHPWHLLVGDEEEIA